MAIDMSDSFNLPKNLAIHYFSVHRLTFWGLHGNCRLCVYELYLNSTDSPTPFCYFFRLKFIVLMLILQLFVKSYISISLVGRGQHSVKYIVLKIKCYLQLLEGPGHFPIVFIAEMIDLYKKYIISALSVHTHLIYFSNFNFMTLFYVYRFFV